jgi:hypothetical protein
MKHQKKSLPVYRKGFNLELEKKFLLLQREKLALCHSPRLHFLDGTFG